MAGQDTTHSAGDGDVNALSRQQKNRRYLDTPILRNTRGNGMAITRTALGGAGRGYCAEQGSVAAVPLTAG